MNNTIKNTVVLAVIVLGVAGTGYYLTFMKQAEEIKRLEHAEKLMQVKAAEVETLLADHAVSEQAANESITKWRARYKNIPDELTSPMIVRHLNQLTRSGFKNFDVSLEGVRSRPNYSVYTFRITGRGFFSSLYEFLWRIENEQQLYKVRDLNVIRTEVATKNPETGIDRVQMMVSFTMNLDAFYGVLDGASATDDVMVVPASVLPSTRPANNPFYPIIMANLPPNSEGRVDIERATLVSIFGKQALFKDTDGFKTVQEGDAIYLGRITMIDPARGTIVARLNKGGIVDEVELNLHDGERITRSLGAVRLIPIEQQE